MSPSHSIQNSVLNDFDIFNHPDHWQCLKWSSLSRFLCLIVQIVSINTIPLHNADAFKPDEFLQNETVINKVVNQTLVGFARWDSLYFIHIARRGYSHEAHTAFFPLYPGLIRAVKNVLFPWAESSHDGLFIVTGVLINLILFIVSSIILYELTHAIFRNRPLALETVKLFCFNPASIFMTACYSESLFQFFTLSGLLAIEFGKLSLASTFLAGSSMTRSNGIVSIGFVAYWHVTTICILSTRVLRSTRLVEQFFIFVSHALMILLPFILVQTYSYIIICMKPELPDRVLFCSSFFRIPYTFIQRKYWNIGLFKYYKMQQIPNFLLASPMILICLWIVFKYFKVNGKQFFKLILDFQSRRRAPVLWNNGHCLPYIVHLAFLTFVSVFYMHVQVTTRFVLSSTPVVYWAIASSSMSTKNHLKSYFFSYFILGTILHSTFYPWT